MYLIRYQVLICQNIKCNLGSDKNTYTMENVCKQRKDHAEKKDAVYIGVG